MCRGKRDLPTPVQLCAAPSAVLARMLTDYQAGHANLALEGIKCVLLLLTSESAREPIGGAENALLQGCVTSIVHGHTHHAPIQKLGNLALVALAQSWVQTQRSARRATCTLTKP